MSEIGLTLTDEQWQKVKVELMSDMKEVFRDVVYEIMETQIDFEEAIIQMISEKVSEMQYNVSEVALNYNREDGLDGN